MANTFSKEFSISSFDLNPKGQARLTTMADFFQEMAYHHASHLGFGYDDMNEKQTMWVLSRMRIRIDRYPVWDERVKVETWHKGMERIFGLRDFKVTDSSDRVIGSASSAWLILDSKTKRPVRPNDEVLRHGIGEESVFEAKLEKIQHPAEMEEKTVRKVVFSDLDIMGHVNNVKYMEWCIDTAMSEQNVEREIREIEINFMHEALLGDVIIISGLPEQESGVLQDSKQKSMQDLIYIGKRKGDAQEIFRTRLSL